MRPSLASLARATSRTLSTPTMPPKRRMSKAKAAAGTAGGGPAAKRVKAEPTPDAVATGAATQPHPAPPPCPRPSKKPAAAATTVKAEPGASAPRLPGPYPRPACVSPDCAPLPVRAACGRLRFADLDPALAKVFRPRLTPEQVIRAGSFGGIYFNPIGGKPGIHGRRVAIDADEFPASWFAGLDRDVYAARRYDAARNAFGVKAGQDQAFWEEKGWMRRDLDPRGWFHWYCRFYLGRRTTDGEDARQISRWNGVAGLKGRWRRALANKAAAKGLPAARAHEVSPVISQTLLHWADKLTDKDVDEALKRMKG